MVYAAHAVSHTLELSGAAGWFDLPTTPGIRHEVWGGVLAAFAGLPPVLTTSVWSGPVSVRLTVHESCPEYPSGTFDVVVEASVLVQEGRFGLRGPEDSPGLVEQYGVWLTGGWVRMRVSGAGREEAYDEAVDRAVERYMVQVWPAEPSTTVDLASGERVQRVCPVIPVADSAVRVEPVRVAGSESRVPRRPERGPIRG